MADATIPYGRKTQRAPDVPEIHVLWLTAGLGCDGDTVAITAATQPRLDADRQIPLGANEPNTDGILGAGSCAAE